MSCFSTSEEGVVLKHLCLACCGVFHKDVKLFLEYTYYLYSKYSNLAHFCTLFIPTHRLGGELVASFIVCLGKVCGALVLLILLW